MTPRYQSVVSSWKLACSAGTGSRSYATRQMPQKFDYRVPSLGAPVPSVMYTTDADEADELLESLRSTRLTMTIGSHSGRRALKDGSTMSSPGKLALIALADQEGVLLLHTALMDRKPHLLGPLLSNPNITKQGCGIPSYIHRFAAEKADWNTTPANFLDLRSLGAFLYPELLPPERTERLVHAEFSAFMVQVLLGQSFTSRTNAQITFRSSLKGSPSLNHLVNECWSEHLIGTILHESLDLKMVEIAKAFVEDHNRTAPTYQKIDPEVHAPELQEEMRRSIIARRFTYPEAFDDDEEGEEEEV